MVQPDRSHVRPAHGKRRSAARKLARPTARVHIRARRPGQVSVQRWVRPIFRARMRQTDPRPDGAADIQREEQQAKDQHHPQPRA